MPGSMSCSSNHAASGTARFGATIDVEMNHVRFLGSVVLNLWDCGGQEAFMDSYLTRQRSTIFSDVGVLIYVFDVESRDTERDLGYYIDCLDACRKNSPEAEIFVLLHKMDLCEHRRDPVTVFDAKRQELLKYSGNGIIKMFPTSIYDESLYRVSDYQKLLSWARLKRVRFHKGLVANCSLSHPKCSPAFAAPDYVCRNLQCGRGCALRANYILNYRPKRYSDRGP